jgi:hypothetical protein
MGTSPTPEWGIAGLSLELDESAQTGNSVIFSACCSPALTLCLAGFGSVPAHAGGTEKRRSVAAVIRFVINYLATVIWRNIFPSQNATVCLNVQDLLRPHALLAALPPSLEHCSADSADAVVEMREGMRPSVSSTSCRSISPESAFLAFPSSEAKLSDVASRQQFLLALLEDCSFFAHLVLRCVRAASSSPDGYTKQESAKPGSNSRLTAGMQSKTQPISASLTYRSQQSSCGVEAQSLSPLALWVNVACRHVRLPGSPEGMS